MSDTLREGLFWLGCLLAAYPTGYIVTRLILFALSVLFPPVNMDLIMWR